MKRNLLKHYNKIILLFLSILGIGSSITFSGCDKINPVEYGTPSARFKVVGKITAEDNSPIRHIKVVMQHDSAYSDEIGGYAIQTDGFPMDQEFIIQFKDVDSILNGSFQSKDTLVSFTDPQFVNGDGHWYEGEVSQTIDIKLKQDSW